LWEWIEGFGALVGLATGVYVLLDRLTENYPTALFVPKPLGDFGRQTVYLRVHNPSERPILIRLRNGSTNGEFRPAEDHSTRAILSAALPGETWLPLLSKDTVDLPLLKPLNYEEMDDESEIVATLYWRFAQPAFWRGERRIVASIQRASY